MIDVLVGLLLGVILTLIILYILEELKRRENIVLDDPTDDEEYQDIVKQLKCPGCYSTDYRFEEVSDLAWIQGEDRYCVCNKCGRRFGDGK